MVALNWATILNPSIPYCCDVRQVSEAPELDTHDAESRNFLWDSNPDASAGLVYLKCLNILKYLLVCAIRGES